MRAFAATVLALSLATSASHARQDSQPLVFAADMRGDLVAPAAVQTEATAKATGVLIGNRFLVHGSFVGLSSRLRDLDKTPNDPGVHLHRGAPGITTPYFHGLQARLSADGRSGIFYGAVTLSDEQKRALLAAESYIDIHTVKNGPGEVRDQWRPVDPSAAEALLAELGAHVPATTIACHSAVR
jgi:hypothetical protein